MSLLGISDFAAFCFAILVFLALPGPGTFALLHSTGKGGFAGGAAATAGVIAGDQVLMWMAVGGVAAVCWPPPPGRSGRFSTVVLRISPGWDCDSVSRDRATRRQFASSRVTTRVRLSVSSLALVTSSVSVLAFIDQWQAGKRQ